MLIVYGTKYLTKNLEFAEAGEPLIVIIEDLNFAFRIKTLSNKYLAEDKNGELYFSSTANDDSLFGNIRDAWITTHNNVMTISESKIKFERYHDVFRYPKLIFDIPSDLYLMFINYGIVHFPLCESLLCDLKKAREILHTSPHKRISDLMSTDPCFGNLINDSGLKSLLRRIFDKFHLTTYSSNTLSYGEGVESWHVDYPYHNLPEIYPEEILGVQVIIAVDDFTLENGATRYIPNSHLTRIFPRMDMIQPHLEQKTIVKAGTVIIYQGTLWHTEGTNITQKKRGALLANFSPLHIQAKDKNITEGFPFKRMSDGTLQYSE